MFLVSAPLTDNQQKSGLILFLFSGAFGMSNRNTMAICISNFLLK